MLDGSVGISDGGAYNCRRNWQADWSALLAMAGSAGSSLLVECQEYHSSQQKLHGYCAHASSSRP